MAADYAWIIDKDHVDGDDVKDGCAGVRGPRDAPQALLDRLANSEGLPFRMRDDDGELYYEGRLVRTYDSYDDDLLGPLQDFGMPMSGATIIEYENEDGSWEEV